MHPGFRSVIIVMVGQLMEGYFVTAKSQKRIQLSVVSPPNKMANAMRDMFPFAVDAYAENNVYLPKLICAASACIT